VVKKLLMCLTKHVFFLLMLQLLTNFFGCVSVVIFFGCVSVVILLGMSIWSVRLIILLLLSTICFSIFKSKKASKPKMRTKVVDEWKERIAYNNIKKHRVTMKFSPIKFSAPTTHLSLVTLSSFEEENIKENNSIFLMETQSPISLTGRKLCAIESAARRNPQRTIYVLLNTKDEKIHMPLR